MTTFQLYVRAAEKAARMAGVNIGMAQLRDAISKALFNRPYSAAVAADKAGKLPAITLPPPFLATTAERYRLDLADFAALFPTLETALAPASPHLVLRAESLKELLATSKDQRLRGIRNRIASGGNEAIALRMAMATLAGIAYLLASRLSPRLEEDTPLRVAVFGYEFSVIGDYGKALQLIRGMLDCKCDLEFDVIADRLHQEFIDPIVPQGPSGLGRFVEDLKPARFFKDYQAYAAASDSPEVAVALYPDWIDSTDDILTSKWPLEFVQRDIPVMGMCYDDIQQDIIGAVVQGYGLGEAINLESPINDSIDGPGFTNHLGQYLFVIDADSGSKGSIHQRSALTHADVLNQLMRGHASKFRGAPPPGSVIQFDQARLAFGTNDRAVDLKTGQPYVIGQLNDEGFGLRPLPYDPIEPWTPIEPTTVLRRSEVILMVDAACQERLFPSEFFKELQEGGTGYIEELVNSLPENERAAAATFLNAAISGKSGMDEGNPLFIAAANDDAEAIIELASGGAILNARDTEGWTPLAEAAGQNSAAAIRALIQCGANPNICTVMGHYPLTIALSRGHDAAGLALLEGGADPDKTSVNGASGRSLVTDGYVTSPAIHAWFERHR